MGWAGGGGAEEGAGAGATDCRAGFGPRLKSASTCVDSTSISAAFEEVGGGGASDFAAPGSGGGPRRAGGGGGVERGAGGGGVEIRGEESSAGMNGLGAAIDVGMSEVAALTRASRSAAARSTSVSSAHRGE